MAADEIEMEGDYIYIHINRIKKGKKLRKVLYVYECTAVYRREGESSRVMPPDV